MIRNARILICMLILMAFASACSTGGTTGQADTPMPQPQLRAASLPSATPAPVQEVTSTPLPELTNTPAPLYYDPTPDVDMLANHIESMISDLERKLKNQNFILK